MKVAISVWENRVSPLFDAAGHILLVSGQKAHNWKQELLTVDSLTVFQRLGLLRKLKVDLFICGGITVSILEQVRNIPIQTIPFICGNVDTIIEAVMKGKDLRAMFSMPGHSRKESS